MIKPLFLFFTLLFTVAHTFSQLIKPNQEELLLELRNCQGEMRTVPFQGQMNVLKHCVLGKTTLATQRVIHFSRNYKVDTVWFNLQVEKIRKTLPASYFSDFGKVGVSGGWYDNIPDEKAIWFIYVFAHKNKNGTYKAYSAIEVYFEGDNAHIDEQRENPVITNIKFIFDPAGLKVVEEKLKTSHPVS